MFYEPKDGHGLPHDPFKAIVAPRPIGWVSTLDARGRVNLAPYSYFNAVCSAPPIVMFSSEGLKDSASNVRDTREFVANLATWDLREMMNASSAALPCGESEFEAAGIEAVPSRLVAPPRVAEAAAALECVVTEILEPTGRDGAASGSIVVFGEVVGVHIHERALRDGAFDMVAAGTIARCGYRDYARVTDLFQMTRPAAR